MSIRSAERSRRARLPASLPPASPAVPQFGGLPSGLQQQPKRLVGRSCCPPLPTKQQGPGCHWHSRRPSLGALWWARGGGGSSLSSSCPLAAVRFHSKPAPSFLVRAGMPGKPAPPKVSMEIRDSPSPPSRRRVGHCILWSAPSPSRNLPNQSACWGFLWERKLGWLKAKGHESSWQGLAPSETPTLPAA